MQTLLYTTLASHLETFLAQREDRPLPRLVTREPRGAPGRERIVPQPVDAKEASTPRAEKHFAKLLGL